MNKENSKNNLYIDNISKTYRKGGIKANVDITTSFYEGQIVALIGHNGAGKSTLLNQICGNTKPDNGDIIYNNISIKENSKYARRVVSTMPQFHAPLVGVTLSQAITSMLHIRGIVGKDAKERLNQILEDLDIKEWAKHSGDKLSGGLQRLTSFAMAIASPPAIILLDEPTNDVDPVRRKLIWKYIRKLSKKEHIIVVVTHNLLEVEKYCDRYILLDKGKIIKDIVISEKKEVNMLNILSVTTLEVFSDIKKLPTAINIEYDDESKIIFKLSDNQIVEAITWVMEMIANNKIINYSLEYKPLDLIYGGLLNEQ